MATALKRMRQFSQLLTVVFRSAAPSVSAESIPGGILRIRVSTVGSRIMGEGDVSAYACGGLLIDSGCRSAAHELASLLRQHHRPIDKIALTHHHEDHAGGSAILAKHFDARVYMRKADKIMTGGVKPYWWLMAPYRFLSWGAPGHLHANELDTKTIPVEDCEMQAIPTPGHTTTHTVYYHEEVGDVFTGDLFVAPGVGPVLWHEDPFAHVKSLRLIADLKPNRMLPAHGKIIVDDVAGVLYKKADAVERGILKIISGRRDGMKVNELVDYVFEDASPRLPSDTLLQIITQRQWSRRNFVKSVLKRANQLE